MDTKQQFERLLESTGVAMLTTRTENGHLRSRAMANQKNAVGADLWFVTDVRSAKVQDIASDPHINLAYYKDSSREWISISGVAAMTSDRAKIRELYAEDWKMWFREEGREHDPLAGTVDDPHMVLIAVQIHRATFFAVDRAAPMVIYELAKGWLTGTAPDLGEVKTLGGSDAARW